MWEAFRKENRDAALEWQVRIAPLARLFGTKHGIPGIKHAMDLNGFYGGPPRLPLVPPGEADRLEIAQALAGLS